MRLISRDELQKQLDGESVFFLVSKDFSGHRLEWFHFLKRNLMELGKSFTIICQDASRIKTIRSLDKEGVSIFESEAGLSILNDLVIPQNRHEIVFWDADDKLKIILRAKYQARLLIMRPYLTEWTGRSMINFISKYAVVCYLAFFTTHEIALLCIHNSNPTIFRKKWVEDELILEPRDFQDNQKKFSQYRILIPGYISERKNPILAIQACEQLIQREKLDIQLSLIGSIQPEIFLKLIREKKEWVTVEDNYLERNDYLSLIGSYDLVLLPYLNRGSSAVVLEALALGKRVAITKNRHWKHLAAKTDGQLILMKQGKRAIISSIRSAVKSEKKFMKLTLNNQSRKSVMSFILFGD